VTSQLTLFFYWFIKKKIIINESHFDNSKYRDFLVWSKKDDLILKKPSSTHLAHPGIEQTNLAISQSHPLLSLDHLIVHMPLRYIPQCLPAVLTLSQHPANRILQRSDWIDLSCRYHTSGKGSTWIQSVLQWLKIQLVVELGLAGAQIEKIEAYLHCRFGWIFKWKEAWGSSSEFQWV